MSNSRFKGYQKCAFQQWMLDHKSWKMPYKKAFLIGSYVDAFLLEDETVQEELLAQNADKIFKKRGGMYADFENASKMVDFVKSNQKVMSLIEKSEAQKIVKFDLDGYKWKGKIDMLCETKVYHETKTLTDPDKIATTKQKLDSSMVKQIIDLKTTATSMLELQWDAVKGIKVPTWELYSYHQQLALYAHATGTIDNGAKIIAISKSEPFVIEELYFEPEILKQALNNVRAEQEEVHKLFNSKEAPQGCMTCDCCKEMIPYRKHTITKEGEWAL